MFTKMSLFKSLCIDEVNLIIFLIYYIGQWLTSFVPNEITKRLLFIIEVTGSILMRELWNFFTICFIWIQFLEL